MKNENQNAKPVFKVGELVPKYIKFEEFYDENRKISSALDAVSILRRFFDPDQINYREMFYVMFLNRNNNILSVFKVSEGGISTTLVDVKMIFSQALLVGASCIVLAHNHPSGSLTPSKQDIDITSKIKSACLILDMHLLDHVILTDTSYISLAEEGLF
jgi:DNA repair protein RadC